MRLGIMQDEYHWHKHDNDEFLMLEGHFVVELEDQRFDLGPQQGVTVPKGIVHRTLAPESAVVLMVETTGIVPTGDAYLS